MLWACGSADAASTTRRPEPSARLSGLGRRRGRAVRPSRGAVVVRERQSGDDLARYFAEGLADRHHQAQSSAPHFRHLRNVRSAIYLAGARRQATRPPTNTRRAGLAQPDRQDLPVLRPGQRCRTEGRPGAAAAPSAGAARSTCRHAPSAISARRFERHCPTPNHRIWS